MLTRKIEQLTLQNELVEDDKIEEWHLQILLEKANQSLSQKDTTPLQFKLLLRKLIPLDKDRLNDPDVLTKLCKLVLGKKCVINPQQLQVLFKYDNVFRNIVFLNIGKKTFYFHSGGNMITNIEPLTFLDMPCMLFLYVFQNKCISIKPLAKANFKSLNYLNLPVGEIKSLSGMQRANLPMLQAIITCYSQIKSDENKIHTFYELFKLNSAKSKYILLGDQFDLQNDSPLSYTRMLKKQLSFR